MDFEWRCVVEGRVRLAGFRCSLALTVLLGRAAGAGSAIASVPCPDETLRPDGSVLRRVVRDCVDGSFLAEVRFDSYGNPRLVIDSRDGRRFRMTFGRTGLSRSARYATPEGLDVRFAARRARIQGLGPIGGVHSIFGQTLYLGPESITHYDLHGRPAQRVDLSGRPSYPPSAASPAPRTDDYGRAFDAGIRAASDRGDGDDGVIFGDSIVQQLVLNPDTTPLWRQLKGDHRFMSAAIAGDRVRHALDRTWAIAATAKLVAIQIGTNDHDQGAGNPNDTAEGIANLVARATHLAPEAIVLLIAIPPTTDPARHEKNVVTNDRLATLVDGDRVRMLSPPPPDMSDPAISPDGLHFTAAGAALWYGPLVPVFAEILGR